MSETSGRIRELDGWRAIAVSMVIVGHFFLYQHGRAIAHFPWLASRVNMMGYLGVQIFFVISGFVICRLLLREEMEYGSFSVKGFYIRRVFRILPPFYLYLFVVVVLAALGLVEATGKDIAKAALFLADFHSTSASWVTGHAWSLAVEEQFYLFLPTTLWITPRRWRRIVCALICALCIAWTFAISLNEQAGLLSIGIVEGFVCIFGGVLVALHEERARHVVAKIPSFAAFIFAAILLVHPFGGFKSWQSVLYQAIVVPSLIAMMLLSTMERKSLLRSMLCWRPVQAVGVTSYAIYLWQEIFMGPRYIYHGVGRVIPYLLPTLGVIIPASWILVEKPAMRFGRTLSRRARFNEPLLPLSPTKLPQSSLQ